MGSRSDELIKHLFSLIKLLGIKLGRTAEIVFNKKGSDLGAQVALIDVAVLRGSIIKHFLSHFKNTPDSVIK
jgi:hypothetical protein